MEKTSKDWDVMKRFEVTYKSEKLNVDLIVLQGISGREWYFDITTSTGEQFLLSKRWFPSGIIWIGGISRHKESQKMGPEIERQLGHPLPLPESSNPFEYTGDLEIRIERFLLGNIPAEKAKNPYSHDMWYRVYFPETTIVFVKSQNIDRTEFYWLLESPANLNREQFDDITELVDLYEKKRQDNP